MSILEELEASARSDAPLYHEFLYRYDPKKKQVFAFYEGDEDSSFYHNIFVSLLDSDCTLEEIVAGCKNNVLKLQREFDWTRYNEKQIAFFVDRDLSYWLGSPPPCCENVFVTDGYSVENYITNANGFTAWLVHFEGFARAKKQEIDSLVSEYELISHKFEKEIMPIMAKAVVAKRHDDSISLSDFKLSRNNSLYFSVIDGRVSFELYDGKDISDKWKLKPDHQAEVEKQIERFKNEKDRYSVRGKWLLCFMAEFGEYARLNANIFAPSLGCSGKASPTCAVPPAHCFSALAPYCTVNIPERLLDFTKKTYQSFLKENYSLAYKQAN